MPSGIPPEKSSPGFGCLLKLRQIQQNSAFSPRKYSVRPITSFRGSCYFSYEVKAFNTKSKRWTAMKTRGYRKPRRLGLILSLVWGTIMWTTPVSASPADSSSGVKFSRSPLRFELNEGQIDPQVRFTARDRDGIAFLTSGGTVLQIFRRMGQSDSHPLRAKRYQPGCTSFRNVVYSSETGGCEPDSRVTGMERLPGVTNYLTR